MTTLVGLRVIHIVVGAFWMGALVFIAGFVLPSVRAAGPAGGAVMQQLIQHRHLHRYMVAASWLTLLSGGALAWRDAGSLGFGWFAQGAGRMFGVGALFAIAAMVVGLTVNAPTAQRIAALSARAQHAGASPSPEDQAQLQRLQARIARAGSVNAILLLLAVAAMAVARYAP